MSLIVGDAAPVIPVTKEEVHAGILFEALISSATTGTGFVTSRLLRTEWTARINGIGRNLDKDEIVYHYENYGGNKSLSDLINFANALNAALYQFVDLLSQNKAADGLGESSIKSITAPLVTVKDVYKGYPASGSIIFRFDRPLSEIPLVTDQLVFNRFKEEFTGNFKDNLEYLNSRSPISEKIFRGASTPPSPFLVAAEDIGLGLSNDRDDDFYTGSGRGAEKSFAFQLASMGLIGLTALITFANLVPVAERARNDSIEKAADNILGEKPGTNIDAAQFEKLKEYLLKNPKASMELLNSISSRINQQSSTEQAR